MVCFECHWRRYAFTEWELPSVGFGHWSSVIFFQEFLIESSDLDKIWPFYEATLFICTSDKLFSVSVPCHGIVIIWCKNWEKFHLFRDLMIYHSQFLFIFLVSVFPGCLQLVRAQPQVQESNLLPGCIFKNLKLEVCWDILMVSWTNSRQCLMIKLRSMTICLEIQRLLLLKFFG